MQSVDPPIVWNVGSASTWEEKDLSSYVSADDVAVWVTVANNSASGTYTVGTGHTDSSWESSNNYSVLWNRNRTDQLVWLDSNDKINTYTTNTANVDFILIATLTANDVEAWDSFPTLKTYGVTTATCDTIDLTSEIPSGASIDAPLFDWRDTHVDYGWGIAGAFDLTATACTDLRHITADIRCTVAAEITGGDAVRLSVQEATHSVVLRGFLQASSCELNTGTVTPIGTTSSAWNELEAIASPYTAALYWIERSVGSSDWDDVYTGLRPKGASSTSYLKWCRLENNELSGSVSVGTAMFCVAGTDNKVEYYRHSSNVPTIKRLAYLGGPSNTVIDCTTDALSLTEYQSIVNSQINIITVLDVLVSTEYLAEMAVILHIITVPDVLALTAYLANISLPQTVTITETLNIIDSYIAGLIHDLSFSDSFTIDDASTTERIVRLFEVIETTTTLSTQGILNRVITELTTLSESFSILYPYSIVDNITIDEQVTTILQYLELILETSNVSDVDSNHLDGYNQILENLGIDDFASKFFVNLILDIIHTTASYDTSVLFKILAEEDITASETASNTLTLSMIANENVTIGEDFTPNYIGQILLIDGAKFSVDFDFDDRAYSGWVINPETSSVSNYDFSFTGSALFEDNYLFTDSSGLYELGGSLDKTDFIVSNITTAALDFDSDSDKQVPQVLLGVTGDNLILRASVDDKQVVYYELQDTSSNLSTKQIKIGKGLIGKNWQFDLQTVDESDLTLDSIEFYPVILKRKH